MSTQSESKSKPAVRLVLGSQPQSFALPVTINRLDGSTATIVFTCKAMRKTELAKAKDQLHQASIQAATARAEERPTATEDLLKFLEANGTATVVQQGLEADSAFILSFATSWDVADPLNAENLQLLEDECGGSFRRIVEAYDAAIFHGRLGN